MNAGKDSTHSGLAAEARAAQHLAAAGLRVVARNHRCAGGEIDIVCRDGPVLVFVEVRHRSHRSFGGAAASITAGKRQRLIIAARHYLATHPADAARSCRFDCVLFDGGPDGPVEWLRNAFDAE